MTQYETMISNPKKEPGLLLLFTDLSESRTWLQQEAIHLAGISSHLSTLLFSQPIQLLGDLYCNFSFQETCRPTELKWYVSGCLF